MMVKQMSNANTVPSETAGLSPMALDNEVLQTLPNRALEQMVRRAMPKAPPAAASLSLNNGNFVARLSIPAKVASQQSGIPHQLIVAQAALESGWGSARSRPRTARRATTCSASRPAAAGTGR